MNIKFIFVEKLIELFIEIITVFKISSFRFYNLIKNFIKFLHYNLLNKDFFIKY